MNHSLLQCSSVLQPHVHDHTSGGFIPLLFISLVFALYVVAAFALWQRKAQWHKWRVASFVGGCVLAGISFSPAMLDYAHHDFRGHMLQHLLLGMLAPIGLVLGAPVLLALEVLPRRGARWLSRVLGSRSFHFISHPVTALVLNIGGMYVLYLTPLYNRLHESTVFHLFVHAHFLLAGYLFTWALIGPDPAPRRPSLIARIVVLFFSIAAHSYLSKFMFAYRYPRTSLHSEAEIQSAAKMMYYGGDVIELLLLIALFTMWYRKKGKPHYRFSVQLK